VETLASIWVIRSPAMQSIVLGNPIVIRGREW
jgi:hypothetical protein